MVDADVQGHDRCSRYRGRPSRHFSAPVRPPRRLGLARVKSDLSYLALLALPVFTIILILCVWWLVLYFRMIKRLVGGG